MTPKRPGWYWFLPDEHCPTPTGLLRIDKPVVLLVGCEKVTRDGRPGALVVRFSVGTYRVDELSGDWESITEPRWMTDKTFDRIGRRIRKDASPGRPE